MAAQKYPSVDHLGMPDGGSGWNGFLYVAQLANGLIKIGSTLAPRERACQLQREWEQAVVAMAIERLPENSHRFNTERLALSKLYQITPPAKGREYFSDISFSDAKAVIAEAARNPSPCGVVLPYLPKIAPKFGADLKAPKTRKAA